MNQSKIEILQSQLATNRNQLSFIKHEIDEYGKQFLSLIESLFSSDLKTMVDKLLYKSQLNKNVKCTYRFNVLTIIVTFNHVDGQTSQYYWRYSTYELDGQIGGKISHIPTMERIKIESDTELEYTINKLNYLFQRTLINDWFADQILIKFIRETAHKAHIMYSKKLCELAANRNEIRNKIIQVESNK